MIQKERFMPQTYYELIWLFFIYAVIGWCSEVAYAALETGDFVNRGFLNGPYCPIYGFGITLVLIILIPLKDNLLILYFGSVLVTSVIEFITGYVLEKVFHNKWWDYTDKPFNIMGYVCLKFSLFWGFACTFIVLILHPIIYKVVEILPFFIGIIILIVISIIFVIDCGITIATILKFNHRLQLMNEIAEKIHHFSDEIGENIYENVTEALEKTEEFQENHEEQLIKIAEKKEEFLQKKDEITENITEKTQEAKLGREVRKIENKMEMEQLKKQYYELMEKKILGDNRLMKAFPRMSSKYHNETLQKFKDYRLKKVKRK